MACSGDVEKMVSTASETARVSINSTDFPNCRVCGFPVNLYWNFCPNCGVRLRLASSKGLLSLSMEEEDELIKELESDKKSESVWLGDTLVLREGDRFFVFKLWREVEKSE